MYIVFLLFTQYNACLFVDLALDHYDKPLSKDMNNSVQTHEKHWSTTLKMHWFFFSPNTNLSCNAIPMTLYVLSYNSIECATLYYLIH